MLMQALEKSWQIVAEHFSSFDTDFNGMVSCEEFKDGVVALRIEALTDKKVIELVTEQLDSDSKRNVSVVFRREMATSRTRVFRTSM